MYVYVLHVYTSVCVYTNMGVGERSCIDMPHLLQAFFGMFINSAFLLWPDYEIQATPLSSSKLTSNKV